MNRMSNFQTALSCFGRRPSILRSRTLGALLALTVSATAWAGTFGKVVPIGGYASDIVIDEPRGVLYIADFTANRIEVMNLSSLAVTRSINVNPQPGSMAMSPDGNYLVIGHYGNFSATSNVPAANALTVISLGSNAIQTFSLGFLSTARNRVRQGWAGADSDVERLPAVRSGLGRGAGARHDGECPRPSHTHTADAVLPVATSTPTTATLPPAIITGSVAASGNGFFIYGLTNQVQFQYDVLHQVLTPFAYAAPPTPLGPRLVSVSNDGTLALNGWEVTDYKRHVLYDFPNPGGLLNVGTHVIDSNLNVIYAQIPPPGSGGGHSHRHAVCDQLPSGRPMRSRCQLFERRFEHAFEMVDSEQSHRFREQFLLPENLGGRSVLNKAGDTMYAISDSGVTVFSVGPKLSAAHRLVASQESVLFQGNGCAHGVVTQQITITDPGGGATDFQLAPQGAGVILSPAAGVTPATVSISYDPVAFQNQKGTITIPVQLISGAGVNPAQTFNVLVNNTDPDQRGSVVRLPGSLTDVLPDPGFDRYYVLRQDKNEIFAYDAGTNALIATLRTGNVPTQMAITADGGYLLVGHDASQYIAVFNLSTLAPDLPVIMPAGHYPRSVAVSGTAILAASLVTAASTGSTVCQTTNTNPSTNVTVTTTTNCAPPGGVIDIVDFTRRVASIPATLGTSTNGIFANKLNNIDTILTSTPNGSSIVGIGADGTFLMFDGNANTFTIDRVNASGVSGCGLNNPCPYAASSFGSVVIGNTVLNSSLIPTGTLSKGGAIPTGFAFIEQLGYMTSSSSISGPGVIQKINLPPGTSYQATRLVESPTITPAANAAALASVAGATASKHSQRSKHHLYCYDCERKHYHHYALPCHCGYLASTRQCSRARLRRW